MFIYVANGSIPAQRIGRRGIIRFNLESVRKFATDNGKFFDEKLAADLLAKAQ